MEPKNLLFIISDQHNRDLLGCYGHAQVQTPHLDSLAGQGVRFDAAYTNCPICVPARASLATGQYVHRIGYWDNAFPYEGRVRGWGQRLIEAGHEVDSIGKLHYRSADDADGFGNHVIPLNVVDGVGDVMGSIRDVAPVRHGAREGVINAGFGNSTYLDYDRRVAEHARQWLRKRADRRSTSEAQKPWMLFVSFVCPHPPYIAPEDYADLYPLDQISLPVQSTVDQRPTHPALETFRRVMGWEQPFSELEMRRMIAAYMGCCTHLDQQVGHVLDTLDQLGLRDETRIVYTSDHGESLGRHGLWGKFTMFEDSAAVPLILAGPDVPRGQVSDDPVSLVDCYQTIRDCVGLAANASESELPGRSLWRIAQGQKLGRSVLSEYHAVGSETAAFMLRRDDWKYVHYVGLPPQLFHLSSDPDEMCDLSQQPECQHRLQDLERELRGLLDPEDVDRRAKLDQRALVESHGGPAAVLGRGTFTNSPVPGETPQFHAPDS
ncbi:MAG: sulfatase-like hydrolase/transferase [Planctomycetaceae bacterium]